MKKVVFNGFLFLAVLLVFISCAEDVEQTETGYLPFKSSQDGKWGMIGTDGTVLFEEEFKDEPTSAKNGRFMVKNGNGLWEIYTAESKPEKIGEEYLQIADFTASVTPSVKKNEKITLIDVDGDIKATLDKVNNKNIIGCSKFKYGYATIIVEDNLCGIIDTKGKVVIEPKYSAIAPFASGKFIASVKEDDSESSTLIIMGKDEEKILEIKVGDGQKYTNIDTESSTSEYLAVCTSVDGESQWGYIDYNKNIIVKPSSKIKSLGKVKGNRFIFNNGENYGVMDFNGEIVLRAKYDMLEWADDDVLIAYDSEDKYSLINLEGEKLTKEKYLSILPFFDGKHAAVKIDDNSWGFINKKGEELKIKNAPDIYYLAENSACWIVESDFVDIDAIVSRLNLNKNGLMGFNLDMMPQQVIKAYNEVEGNTNEKLELKAEDNRGRDNVVTAYSSRGLEIDSKVYYQRYMTENVNGNIVWSKDRPHYIEAYVGGDMINGKVDLLYTKIAAIVKSYGKVMRENSGAVVVKLSDERGWVVTNEKSKMHIKIYNNGEFQNYPIDYYAKENETTKEYIKSVESFNSDDDIEIVDSVDIPEDNNHSYSYNGRTQMHGVVDKYPITMTLQIKGSVVRGSLFYDRYGSENSLFLSGTLNNNQITLDETDANGQKTGRFRGYYTNSVFQGEYTTNNGKSMSFRVSG